MQFCKYQKLAEVTVNRELTHKERCAMTVMGLGGEAGEAIDMLKKHLFHGHKLDIKALEKELGDILWYLATTATTHGLDLEVIAVKNIEKLKTRYPQGFSEYDSIHRKEDNG